MQTLNWVEPVKADIVLNIQMMRSILWCYFPTGFTISSIPTETQHNMGYNVPTSSIEGLVRSSEPVRGEVIWGNLTTHTRAHTHRLPRASLELDFKKQASFMADLIAKPNFLRLTDLQMLAWNKNSCVRHWMNDLCKKKKNPEYLKLENHFEMCWGGWLLKEIVIHM